MQIATNMTFLAVCLGVFLFQAGVATAATDEKIGTSVGAKAQLTLQTAAKIRSNMLVASPCDNDADCNFPRGRCEPSAKADVDGKKLKICLCASPWYGSDCTQVDKQALCEPTCKNGGECAQTRDENNELKGVCVCPSGFVGSDCGSKGCPNKCNGHGICKVTTDATTGKAKGRCFCENGFAGKGCERKVCPYTTRGECDNAGRCIQGSCMCREGYFGRACTKRRCTLKCSGHGVCTNRTFACDCDPGFVGLNCEKAICPKTKQGTCSGHGSCNALSGKCKCDTLWDGEACNYKKCNGGAVGCSGHGRCEDSKCICDIGFMGIACESKACPMNCLFKSGHGECIEGQCQCYPGYTGDGCEQKMAVPQPCGDKCQSSCLFASPQTCSVPVPALARDSKSNAEVDNDSKDKGKKFAGAQCYQKCLWRCVRGCFAKLSPAAARAEAEHWNATASELESWQLEAKKEYNRLESEVSNSDSNADNTNKNGESLEDRVEKLRKIVDYVEALKVAANKEKKSSMTLASIGNKAEEAVGV